jgi:hypothetical protein
MTHRPCILGIVLLAVAGSALGQEKLALRQSFAPGTYEMTLRATADATRTTKGEGEAASTVQTKSAVTATAGLVLGAPDKDGVKKGTFTFRHIEAEITSGPNAVKFDSADANATPGLLADVLKPLVNAGIQFDLPADGNVQNAKGVPELGSLIGRSPAGQDPNDMRMVLQVVHWFYPIPINSFAVGGAMLPSKPVAVGESWKPVHPLDPNNPIQAATAREDTCKLASVEDARGPKARIDVEWTTHLQKPAATGPGITWERADTGTRGYLTFDVARGMIVAQNTSSDLETVIIGSDKGGHKITESTKRSAHWEITLTPVEAGTTAPASAK